MKEMKKTISVIIIAIMSFAFIPILGMQQAEAMSKPGKAVISSISSPDATSITVKWKKVKGAKGYQIRYSMKSSMEGSKIVNLAARSKKLKKLEPGKKYYVQVRAFKKNGKKKAYGKWSKKKVIRTQYSIKYVLKGGTRAPGQKKCYKKTTKTFRLKNPTKAGYQFLGWYTSKKYTTKVTVIKKGSTGNKTLYAKWKKRSAKYSYKLYLMNPEQPLADGTHNCEALLYLKTDNPDPSTIGISGIMCSTMYSFNPKKHIDDINLRFGINATDVVKIPSLYQRYQSNTVEPHYDSDGIIITNDVFKVPRGYFFTEGSGGVGKWEITIWENNEEEWIKACSLEFERIDSEPFFSGYAEELARKYFGSDYNFSWDKLYDLCYDVRQSATYPVMELPNGDRLYDPLSSYGTQWGPSHVMASLEAPALLSLILDHCDGVTYINSADSHNDGDYHAYLDVTFNGETREFFSFCPYMQEYVEQKLILP